MRAVSKRYDGVVDNKDSGIALWVKNAVQLTTNKAASTLALSDLSLTVGHGEILGVYGANGAGKTTLIKLVSGLLAPTSGTVSVLGHHDYRRIKSAVSYISTNGWMGLEWQLTARENLLWYGNLFGLSGARLSRRCDEVLAAVGMTDDAGKRVNELSAGMRQKITIARGLVLDRPVVFYDEPSVSLDVPSARALRDLIRTDATQHGRTTVIASHTPDDLAICDRAMLLWQGRMLALGTAAELARPLAGTQRVDVAYAVAGPSPDIASVPGVTRTRAAPVDVDGIHRVTLYTQRADFSFDALVDTLVVQRVDVRGLSAADVSLRDVYDHYVTAHGGETDAA